MGSGERLLVIRDYGVRIGVRKGMIVIRDHNGGKQEVSVNDIDSIVIATSGVTITSNAVRFLMDNNVDIVFLDSRGLPIGRIYPPYVNRTVETRIEQYRSHFNGLYLQIAKAILYSKLANQAGFMKYLARRLGVESFREAYYDIIGLFKEIAGLDDMELDELRKRIINIEARAAVKYWQAVTYLVKPGETGFTGRNQLSKDMFNVSLNYLYGVLYKDAWKAIVLAGLDPYLGYIHVERSGKPVLVFDFVEMFRVSCVDFPLSMAFYKGFRINVEDGRIPYKDRVKLIEIYKKNMERKIGVNGGKERLPLHRALKKTAFQLAKAVREKTAFEGFVEDW